MSKKFPDLLDDFISYVKVDTASDPTSKDFPSTSGQKELLTKLKGQLDKLGMDWVVQKEPHNYLYAFLAGNSGESTPPVGFIAHVDTSPEEPGKNVKPRVLDYKGGVIDISEDGRICLDPRIQGELDGKAGKTLITASGDTLLGADDKAGVAEIISGLKYLQLHPEIKRSDIFIAFTPDEEIGKGTKYFDTKIFKPEYAYTFDGSGMGYYEEENFNAVNGHVIFHGFNTHAGTAFGKMINSVRASAFFVNRLEKRFTPEGTKGRDGFIHFDSLSGNVNNVQVNFVIRDFSKMGVQRFKNDMTSMKNETEKKFPGIRIEIKFIDAYENMKLIIDSKSDVRSRIQKAAVRADIDLKHSAIRGGTDGARLSFMGIPTPNIFTGGYNFHSKYEFAVLEEMEAAVELMIEIAGGGIE